MPPIRRSVSQKRLTRSKSVKRIKFARRVAPKSYSKAMRKGNKSSLFKISTYVPKVSYLRLRYNQTYILDGSYGTEYYQLAVEMNNPNAPLIQFRGTVPSHDHTNTVGDFSNDITPMFQQYDHGVVVRSQCKTAIRPAPGNYNTERYPVKAGSGTEQNPHYVDYQEATNHAENICWSANVDSLTGIANPPEIHTLRDDTPGAQQKRLTCYPGDRRGIVLVNNYTPQRAFGMKDIGDNRNKIGFTNGGLVNEKHYTQIGIQPLFKSTAHTTGTANKMANMIVTVQLDYVLKFTERKSVNNISRPTAHDTTEL